VNTPTESGGILGGGIFGVAPAESGAPGEFGVRTVIDPEAIPPLACRRNAWRLTSLADAIQSEGVKGAGMASVLSGNAAADATQLAAILREQGRAIEASPDEQSVKAALAAIEALPSAAAASQPATSPSGPGKPKESASPPADSPFGGASETSPF
jgi:hypothetical protein